MVIIHVMKTVKSVGVVGLGYVGLPLALLAEAKDFQVVGIEVDAKKLSQLKKKNPIIDDEIANKRLGNTSIKFTDDFSELRNLDAVIICVPTPVDEHKTPDVSLVEKAVLSAVSQMKNGSLLIVESTINPGVCDEVIIPLIEKETKHEVGKTIHVAHCPERINPGDPKWHVGNINRVIGSHSPAGLELASHFYEHLIDGQVKKMGSLMEAEAVKVVENSFRDINIAFVNELAMSFAKLGINVTKVIDGAATKPFAFMPHYPGIGVGGHCIPVDPYYLIEYAKGKGFDHHFMSLARRINESMPLYAIDTLEKEYKRLTKKTLADSRVSVLGISYKADVADDRESPAYPVIDELKKRGAHIETFDPHIPQKSSVKTLQEALSKSDAVVLITGHKEFLKITPEDLTNNLILLDGRNCLQHIKNKLENQDISYIGIGIS